MCQKNEKQEKHHVMPKGAKMLTGFPAATSRPMRIAMGFLYKSTVLSSISMTLFTFLVFQRERLRFFKQA